MQLPRGTLQKGKNAVHAIQGLAVFVAWALTIAVFTMAGDTDGRTRFYFVLCFLTVPALVYQTAVSMFPRTRKFANPYAFAAVDILFLIFWLSAAIAVAAWVNKGIDVGEKKENAKGKGCEAFGWGSEKKCDLSQVQVGLGVMIFFLFLATTALSLYSAIYFRRHGTMPNARPYISNPTPIDPQINSAFSSNPHDEFDNDDCDDAELGHPQTRPCGPLNQHDNDDEVMRLAPTSQEHRIPRRPLSWEGRGEESYDTSYAGAGGVGQGAGKPGNPFVDVYAGRAELVGDSFRDDVALSHEHGGYASGGGGGRSGRVEFPEADYHR